MHHGGAFSKEGALSYDGGQVAFFGNIDKDVFSYNHLVQLARIVGFMDGDNLFYLIPGRSLDDGIDLLKDDTSALEMMKYANQTNCFEVYIQQREHPIVGDTVQEITTTQVNKGHNKKRLNKKREKRIWSADEENALVDILYEMNNSGRKADTGHKCGYMTYIEKELAKRFPNANIKADPHIQSEVKKLKKMLSYVLDIQQHGSGFGWDDERKMVVGDLELFNGWAKSRNGAANLYMKPFVNYDKLCEIYANDLAKGSKAKGPGDDIDLQEEQSADNMTEPSHQSDSVIDSQSHLQCPGSNPSNGNKSSGSRKRKFVEDDVVSCEFSNLSKSLKNLVEVQTSNAAAMNVIQSAYAHELEAQKQTDKRREQLFSVLTKFPEFTRDQLVKAALIIGQDATKLNMFFTTPQDFKSAFIWEVLRSSK
nr:unnamed protein product [Digitaria exilis]